MFSLRISLNHQDPWPMFSSLFSPTSPCFLKHPCSLPLSLCCCRKCGLWQSEGVSGGVVFCLFPMCSHQVLKVFPVGSPSSQLCSDQVLKVFPSSSQNSQLCSDQVLKVFPSCSPSSQCVPYDISNSNFYPLQV
jgi:hypothetical protein